MDLFGMENVGAMYYVDTGGLGQVNNVAGTGNGIKSGNVLNEVRGVDCSTAMFRPGRILTIGGHSALSAIVDIPGGGAAVVTMSGATSSERKQLTATLLADGTVLATGGSKVRNERVEVNHIAERWIPRTGTWLQGSAGALARLYHSTAVLLPGVPSAESNRPMMTLFTKYPLQALTGRTRKHEVCVRAGSSASKLSNKGSFEGSG